MPTRNGVEGEVTAIVIQFGPLIAQHPIVGLEVFPVLR